MSGEKEDELTDQLCIPRYSVFNETERVALVAGTKGFEAAFAG